MDDLISREKAIARIKKQCEHLHPEYDSRDSIGWFAYHICIGILEVQPKVEIIPEQQWIPCSERMPEDGQEILATINDDRYKNPVIIRHYDPELEEKKLLAWMPLPEAYER